MRCLGRTLGLQLPFAVIIIDTKPPLFLTAKNPQLWISTQFADYSFQLLYKDLFLLAYATSLLCSTASQMEKTFGETLFCPHNLLPWLLGVVLEGHCIKAAAPVKNHSVRVAKRRRSHGTNYGVCFQVWQLRGALARRLRLSYRVQQQGHKP